MQNYVIGSGIIPTRNTISVKTDSETIDVKPTGIEVNLTNLKGHLIKLNYNSSIKRDFTNFYNVKKDDTSLTTDPATGQLKLKDFYVKSIIGTAIDNKTIVKDVNNNLEVSES